MSFGVSSLHSKLTKPTSFFGLKLWVVIIICISLFIVLILLIFALYFFSWRRRKPSNVQFGLRKKNCHGTFDHFSRDRRLLSRNASEVESGTSQKEFVFSDRWSTQAGGKKNDVTDLESIGRIVKAEDFIVEAEAVRSVRHRNLVKLLGYCIEGAFRMLVYEYIDNGNLHQWLHGWRGEVSPLTWDIRMNIILGTAKGLAYLHEDFEPKIVHWHIKSSNILA
ncbi:hypothetical protein F0562_031192 [Nyssa sinensis]|uniref:non-specific serine/threonine protein kinase n=1 Tax=Nyssa sinensis TaxID=561372 RepID=A0A5J5ARG4_9ASTE|nr:hypothetical protein F0562_031192 [Nyssa sinensis]